MFRGGVARIGSSVRAFCTDAAHAPPKKLHGTTGRYAGAVYTAASKVYTYINIKIHIILIK